MGDAMSDFWTKERGVGESALTRRHDTESQRGMDRFEVPRGATVELLTQLVPGSRVRMTDGHNNPRNTHRGFSSKDLSGVLPWGLYSAEEVEATDAPVWVQGGAIGNRYLLDRTPVAYTCGRKPRWPNEGSNESMGHWILMARASRS
jgi:hypothetical protein